MNYFLCIKHLSIQNAIKVNSISNFQTKSEETDKLDNQQNHPWRNELHSELPVLLLCAQVCPRILPSTSPSRGHRQQGQGGDAPSTGQIRPSRCPQLCRETALQAECFPAVRIWVQAW